MNDRVAPAGTPDRSSGGVIVFDRPRSSLVVSILASVLAAALVLVSALEIGLSQWLILVDRGLRGPILQDLLSRIDSGTVAVAVTGLVALAYERFVSYRSEPQRVEIGDQLRIRLSRRRTISLALPLVREVREKRRRPRGLRAGGPATRLTSPMATF